MRNLRLRSTSFLAVLAMLAACASAPPSPQWSPVAGTTEAEYQPYLQTGTGILLGQASLLNRVGEVVKASGRTVTLDPATTVGTEWWNKAGKIWAQRSQKPPSPGFSKARRTTEADPVGRFEFSKLPPGKYYVSAEITWKVGNYNSVQGGVVGQMVEVRDGQTTNVVLSQRTE